MPGRKLVKKLGGRRGRTDEGCFLAEGVRLVEEVLASDWPVEYLAYCPEAGARAAALAGRARAMGLSPVEVDARRMKSLSTTVTPPGVLAVVHRPAPAGLWDGPLSLLVVLDGLQDPGNVGTVIRAADAAACDAVVCLPGTVDPFGPKAVRASMGSVLHLPVHTGAAAAEVAAGLTARQVKTLLADPAGKAVLPEEDLTGPVALILGSEARGPGPAWPEDRVRRVRIPMPGGAESLNVAVAAGIILYEAVRQRQPGVSLRRGK